MTKLGTTLLALTLLPALLAAQTDSSRMRGADSTRARGSHRQSSSGSIGRNFRGRRLTRDQVAQLQTALQGANCDPGKIDSIMGPRTRSAMNCARRNNHIAGNNANELYRSLDLNFANPDSSRMNGTARSGAHGMNDTLKTRGGRGGRGTGRARGDSSGMGRTRPDSTRRPSTRRDTTRPGR